MIGAGAGGAGAENRSLGNYPILLNMKMYLIHLYSNIINNKYNISNKDATTKYLIVSHCSVFIGKKNHFCYFNYFLRQINTRSWNGANFLFKKLRNIIS